MYPIIKSTIKECRLQNDSSDIIAQIKLFMDEYFAHMVAHTQIYVSQEFSASFPYTVIRLSEIAEAIYRKIGSPSSGGCFQDHLMSEYFESCETLPHKNRPQKVFLFGTIFSTGSGHPYHWVEHGIDQIAKRIPEALRVLMCGKTPKNFEIYGIGSPAGELGSLSDKFVMQAGRQPFVHLGKLYAEFIHSLEENGVKELPPAILRLWGVSMGASIAASTAQTLIENKQASQSFEVATLTHIPVVRVNMLVPAGTSTGKLRKWQIPVGFVMDMVYQSLTSRYGRDVGCAEKKFIATIHQKLLGRGISQHTSEEDISVKRRLIAQLTHEFRVGVPIPERLKTNEVIGIYDPLMCSRDFQEEANYRRSRAPGSLGSNIVPSGEQGRRRFAIRMTHNPNVVRKNYFKRLIGVGQLIHKLSVHRGHD